MDPEFWYSRWLNNEIGFHEGRPNDLLVRHVDRLALPDRARVFLPLCGKTRDIHWLLARGHRVVGAELSQVAVEQLFSELAVNASTSATDSVIRYRAPGLDVFAGDVFDVASDALGDVHAVYDRAALVAFPTPVRPRYAAHLTAIARRAQQLLITFEYDQSLVDGPPFSVDEAEVRSLYGDAYEIDVLESRDVAGGLKGRYPATERAWLLRPR